MNIAVGSLNPVKIEAVRSVVLRAWPQAKIEGASVPSGVSDMPMSEKDMIAGARNRAIAVRELLDADFGMGLEGGLHQESFGWTLQGWAVVVDKNGRFSTGGGARIPVSDFIAQRVLAGQELGDIMDDLLQDNNIKQKGGAVAAFTANLITRQEAFAQSVAYALAPFVAPQFYD